VQALTSWGSEEIASLGNARDDKIKAWFSDRYEVRHIRAQKGSPTGKTLEMRLWERASALDVSGPSITVHVYIHCGIYFNLVMDSR